MKRYRKVSRQKKRNTWYLVYRPPGVSKQVWEPAGYDEEEAERLRRHKEVELNEPDYVEPSRASFATVAEEWWSLVASDKYAESTRADYRSIIDYHLVPAFGRISIASIRYRQIQRFVHDKLSAPLSPKRVNNILNVLSVIFTYAVKADLCRENPVAKVERPTAPRTEVDCLDPQELWRLLKAVHETQPYYYPLVLTALFTGMRLGELRSLDWQHVSFENNEILVRKSKSRTETKGPKTVAGLRSIPMSSLVRDALQERYTSRCEGCDLVFPSRVLTPFDPSNVRKRVLRKSLDSAGLRQVTWHSLRHSAASVMALSGADEKEVQMILGHSSIQVTKDLYTHLFHRSKVDAIDRMTERMLAEKDGLVEEEPVAYLVA